MRSVLVLLAAASLACQPPPPRCPEPETCPPPGEPPAPAPGLAKSAVPTGAPPGAVANILAEIDGQSMMTMVERLAAFGTRHTLSNTSSDERGIGAARRYIKAEMERFAADSGREGDLAPSVSFDVHEVKPDGRRIDRKVDVVNVVMVLPGAMPEARDRLYYVMGHYDSRANDVMAPDHDAPGANDDASGTAVAMELGRVLSRHRLDSTVVLMATAGEEQGLLGASGHAEAAKKAGKDIRAVLNNDIVGDPTSPLGGVHDRQVRVFSPGLPSKPSSDELRRLRSLASVSDSVSRQLARYIAEVAAWQGTEVQPMLVFRNDRFLRGGDHTPFAGLGMPAVRFCEVDENYDRQHQLPRSENGVEYGDFARHVDAGYLANVARVNAAAIIHLANAPSSPQNARVLVAGLSNDTTLRWDASPEPDVAGYEVVWRETTSPTWQGAQDAGASTEATVPRSKDNHFFGVRAYDQDGYRSPVSFPGIGRE